MLRGLVLLALCAAAASFAASATAAAAPTTAATTPAATTPAAAPAATTSAAEPAATTTATTTTGSGALPVPLSPSVNLLGQFDWQLLDPATGQPWNIGAATRSAAARPWSRCLDTVWRAAAAGSDCLNVVPTHHWLPPPGGASNRVGAFCAMVHANASDAGASGNACEPWTRARVADFTASMAVCFAEALRQGLTLYVRPHLDDGLGQGAWRNGLLLDPTEPAAGGFSYVDVMLAPLATALRAALSTVAAEGALRAPAGAARPVVYLALQGEMSATIVRHASKWAALLPALREAAASPHADLKLGVGLNFNRLADTSSTSQSFSSSRLSWLAWQLGISDDLQAATDASPPPPIDARGLRRLLAEELDFVGVSAYAPYNSVDFADDELENSAFTLAGELAADEYGGIDLKALLDAGKLELHYSEFGIGGGGNYASNQPAASPDQVLLRPFFGVSDPDISPWANPSNAALRRAFYAKAMRWLAAGDANKTFRLRQVFLWCHSSWDVLGLYPESVSAATGATFRDAGIADAIARYNRAAVAAGAGAGAKTAAAAAKQQVLAGGTGTGGDGGGAAGASSSQVVFATAAASDTQQPL